MWRSKGHFEVRPLTTPEPMAGSNIRRQAFEETVDLLVLKARSH